MCAEFPRSMYRNRTCVVTNRSPVVWFYGRSIYPKVVSDLDEAELAKQLADLEKANLEVGGDSDADSFGDASGGEDDDKDS